jgi:hypothetical protein
VYAFFYKVGRLNIIFHDLANVLRILKILPLGLASGDASSTPKTSLDVSFYLDSIHEMTWPFLLGDSIIPLLYDERKKFLFLAYACVCNLLRSLL